MAASDPWWTGPVGEDGWDERRPRRKEKVDTRDQHLRGFLQHRSQMVDGTEEPQRSGTSVGYGTDSRKTPSYTTFVDFVHHYMVEDDRGCRGRGGRKGPEEAGRGDGTWAGWDDGGGLV